MENTTVRKVVALVRVSTRKQSDTDKMGIPRQLEDIATLCRLHNLEIVGEPIALKGVSGASIQDNDLYKTTLMNILRRPDVAGIVFSVLDRFFRPEDISTFGDVFKPIIAMKANKRLFCDLGELNLNDPNDNLKLTIWGGMAGFERYKIKERTSRGNKMKAVLADTCTKKLPEGVIFKRHNEKVNSGVFGFNEYARTVVAPAFKRVAAGERLMQIAKDMATQAKAFGLEIGTQQGRLCGTKSLRDTLNSRWWLCEKPGNVVANFATWKDENGLNTAEPIVDEMTWQTVQDRLKRNTDSDNWTKQKSIKGDFLAAGLLFCGKCGAKMYHKHKAAGGTRGDTSKRYAIYECSSRYRFGTCDMPRVQAHGFTGTDEVLATELEYKLTQTKGVVAAAVAETIAANQSDENRIKFAVDQKAVRDLERKVANFTEALGEAESREVRQSISKKLESIGLELATARTNVAMLSQELKAAVDPQKAEEHIQTVFAGFASLPKDEQIALLQKHVAKIIYNEPTHANDFFNLDVKMKISDECQANTVGAL